MNNQQRQMQLMSYHMGLNALSEALELAEKAQDQKEIQRISLKIEELITKNEKLQNTEKIWLH